LHKKKLKLGYLLRPDYADESDKKGV